MSFIDSILSRIKESRNSSHTQIEQTEVSEQELSELAEKRTQKIKKLSLFLFYFLGLGLSYQTALFFWNVIPANRVELPGLTASELAKIQQPVKAQSLSSMHIFREVGDESIFLENTSNNSNGSKVVRSNLNVKITGISASTDGRGAVTLVYNNKEDTYGVGDKLGSATIKQIKPNSVILNNGGQTEEVVFLTDEKEPQGIHSPIAEETKKESTGISKEDVRMVRTELLSNPGNLLKYINIKPSMKDGKVIGYELNPGTDNRLFINSGLKGGDIAVEINGRDLTNNAEAMQVMGELQNMTEVSLVIDRNGSRETINLDLK